MSHLPPLNGYQNRIICVKLLFCRECVWLWVLPWLFMSLYKQLGLVVTLTMKGWRRFPSNSDCGEMIATLPVQFKAFITPRRMQVYLVVWYRKSNRQRILIVYRVCLNVRQPLIKWVHVAKAPTWLWGFLQVPWNYQICFVRKLKSVPYESLFICKHCVHQNTDLVLLHIQ